MATRITYDPSRVSARRGVVTKKLQEEFDENFIDLFDAFEDCFNKNSPESRKRIHDAIELLKETDDFEFVQQPDDGPRALNGTGGTTLGSIAPGGVIQALDEQNDPIPGTAFRTAEKAEEAGYSVVVMNDDNTAIKGMKKPQAPTPAPAAPDDGDRKVPVRDSKNRQLGDPITIKEGREDKGLEAILDDDGKVKYFLKKPFIRTRS